MTQGVGVATGIVVVRSLEKSDYAHYALAAAMISASVLIADSGLQATLLPQGAKRLEAKAPLRPIFAAAFRQRAVWGTLVSVVAAFVLASQLHAAGASVSTTTWLTALMVATLATQLVANVYVNFFRITLRTEVLRRVQLSAALARLASIALVAYSFSRTPAALTAVTAVTALGAMLTFRVLSSADARWGPRGETAPTRPLWRNLRAVLPAVLTLIAGEQIFLILLSYRSTPDVIAEISAFSRFGVVFVIVNSLANDVLGPRLARRTADSKEVGLAIARGIAVYVAFSALVIVSVIVASPAILWILGDEYRGLELELVLVASGYAAINLGHTLNAYTQARAWVWGWWIYAPLVAAWAITGLSLNLQLTSNAALFFGAQALPYVALQIYRTVRGLRRMRSGEVSP
ncbi:lipopolysaccharide biosynthesis protein [Demequina sp. NBRC 110052]|uniref:lipopolysaccharide biosynthesis protein n=1 Tax=Demequina sp. NBRC 110052 TaxID=1570341 RepID=UPI00135660AA|nr:hypothetical protein [Demequina sp. NBRC 110052]